MKSKNLFPLIKADLERWRKEKSTLPGIIANTAVNFYSANFQKGGFVDSSLKKWKPRKAQDYKGKGKNRKVDTRNRGVLIGKGSGNKLSRSIKKQSVTSSRIVIGSTVTYAGVHNYGLRSGRGKGFQMPQRQFIGPSKALSNKLIKLIQRRINKSFG